MVLRPLLGQPEQVLVNQMGGLEIASIFAAWRKTLSAAADHLCQIAKEGILSQPLDVLASSFVHLHLKRMAGLDGASEQRILSLLLRTHESLKNVPVGSSMSA